MYLIDYVNENKLISGMPDYVKRSLFGSILFCFHLWWSRCRAGFCSVACMWLLAAPGQQHHGLLSKKKIDFPTSHVVTIRVDSVCVILPSPVIPVARSTAYADSGEPGLREVTMIVGRVGTLKFWHVPFLSYAHMYVCVCMYLFYNKPGCLVKVLCWNQIPEERISLWLVI